MRNLALAPILSFLLLFSQSLYSLENEFDLSKQDECIIKAEMRLLKKNKAAKQKYNEISDSCDGFEKSQAALLCTERAMKEYKQKLKSNKKTFLRTRRGCVKIYP